jgi:membrane protein YqaA with SNARE-associated domain
MNTPSPNVLVIPPHPPAPINTVVFASAGLTLSIISGVVYMAMYGFPNNAPVEQFFAILSSFLMALLGFILGLIAVRNETKRSQFQHVVLRYTQITGDKRYMPYILPVRTKIVSILFACTVGIPLLSYIGSFVGGSIG